MTKFENQVVSRDQCPVERGPLERRNSLHSTQNVFLQDLEFTNCQFEGEGLSTYGAPIHRSLARNIRLEQCTINSFFGHGAIFDEVIVDGLKSCHARGRRSPVILSGCALRHVVLRGECGSFLLNRAIDGSNAKRSAAFNAANEEFYRGVDWALDISDVKLTGLEIRGSIPARLIRRNPEEQFVMTRSVAQSGDWRKLEPFASFQIAISIFLGSGAEDELLVAARRSKDFRERIEYYHRLKLAGLVT